MADPELDDKVSAGYRALGGGEPPRVLDEAILAAARRRAPRWRVPVSIAAVLALAVGVTLRMQPQGPESEPVALAPQVMQAPQPAASPPAPAPEQQKPTALAKQARESASAAARSERRGTVAEVGAPQAPLAPEPWLARIAELRKEGRKREADDSLAEFRKRYPDYRIPEALR